MPGKRRCQPSRRPAEQAVSRSTRAKRRFPVSHVECLLREGYEAQRLSAGTPVFLAGVLESMTRYLLELAGKEAQKGRKMCITPEHVRSVLDSLQLGHLLQDDTPAP